jgi:hypothetical protein
MRFESKRAQNEKKMKKKNTFCNWKNIFSLVLFLAGPLALHFKDDL